MVDILDIKGQRLSTILADYCECHHCHVVDRDPKRSRRGYPCPRCGAKGDGGQVYFHMGVVSVIDLMQEFYHTPSARPSGGLSVTSHKLAVVVFFCTLVETLLENLLREIMCIQNIPADVQERLLADNLTSKQRVSKLFPILAAEKWKEAVAAAGRAHPRADYQGALDFFVTAVGARNKFLHPPSNKWAIREDMPRQCIRLAPVLLSLFVWLHNRYIAGDKVARLSATMD